MAMRSVIKNKDLADKLIPNYELGCKRITPSDTYLQAYNRSNVHLVTSKIDRFTPKGIKTADGVETEVDVIIYATGFDIEKSFKSVPATGR